MRHVKPLSIGLNCSLGPDKMRPFLRSWQLKADTYVSCYPNAACPTRWHLGLHLLPPDMANFASISANRFCEHHGWLLWQYASSTSRIAKAVEGIEPRHIPHIEPIMRLSGSQRSPHQVIKLPDDGERTNVAGSPKISPSSSRKANSRKWSPSRASRVENGAKCIDVWHGRSLIDGVAMMTNFSFFCKRSRK